MMIKLRGIFLIVGTAIGAGILALPIATVESGFWGAFFSLIFTWIFMTMSANNLLKARLVFSQDVDLATMSETLLGRHAKILIDISYLALLYGLVALYITVGAAWSRELVSHYLGHDLSIFNSQIIFTTMIALLIYSGIARLTIVNKIVTVSMLLFMLLIITLSAPSIVVDNITGLSILHIPDTLPMLITTFGFAIVIPALVTYLENDRKVLTQVLITGSLTILVTYVAWEMIAFGVIGTGVEGLSGLASSKDQGTEVINALSHIVNQPIFSRVGFAFMVSAVLSSVFGVGYCLYAYLKDTIPYKKQPANSLLAITSGFITPLVLLNLFPMGVSAILGVSGIFVAVILGLVPQWMVLSRAYNKIKPLTPIERWIAVLSLIFFTCAILLEIKNFV